MNGDGTIGIVFSLHTGIGGPQRSTAWLARVRVVDEVVTVHGSAHTNPVGGQDCD